ncbi:MAG: GNAT family N-acetyltransferase [Candidatus Woesearchaeota archaeon]
MNIRKATLSDLDSCITLLKRKEFQFAHGGYPATNYLKGHLTDYFLVSYEADEIVGCIVGEKLSRGVSMVWFLVVDDSFQGKGIGTSLLTAFEKLALADGGSSIVLYSPVSSPDSIAFYKKQGYNVGNTFVECNKILQ